LALTQLILPTQRRLDKALLGTRRQTVKRILVGWPALTFGAAFAAGGWTPASAEPVSEAELLQPGPLGDRELGPKKAPVTIVEYASMTCPPCARFATTVLPALKARYIDKGKMRFIFREFPFDPVALAAAALARCADEQKYFALIETLYKEQAKWTVASPLPPLLEIAEKAGFTEDAFKACLSNAEVLGGIESARRRAVEQFRVAGTPTFFINGDKHTGIMSLDQIEREMRPYLKK
jgi:protein-disulfide isomerase